MISGSVGSGGRSDAPAAAAGGAPASSRAGLAAGAGRRETEEVRLTAIETIDLHQTTWGRIFGFGDVRVTGRGESSLVFNRVADPVAVKRAIESAYSANVEHAVATGNTR